MLKIKASIIFLFLLVISMGIVCAEDVNQTSHNTLEIADAQDVISVLGRRHMMI